MEVLYFYGCVRIGVCRRLLGICDMLQKLMPRSIYSIHGGCRNASLRISSQVKYALLRHKYFRARIQDFCKGGSWGVQFALLILSHFLEYPMNMKQSGLAKTKLFHFHRIFKNGRWGGGQATPLNPVWIKH